MPDEVTSERVAIIAAAARVKLEPEATERIARVTTPTAGRFAKANIELPMEVEPSTFVVIQRQGSRS